MQDKNKPITKDNVCWNCLKENKLNVISIRGMGYSSQFDNFSTELHICNECLSNTDKKWWELNVINTHEYCEEYEYEEEILNYVSKMPLCGQEMFQNTGDYVMEPQDWIDYKLDVLPHEKCKEYGMYSPQEIQAYEDRFPTCSKVKLHVRSDNSSGCRCHNNAFGKSDGMVDGNISSKCYMCKDYEVKISQMDVIYVDEERRKREIKRLNEMFEYAVKKLKELHN